MGHKPRTILINRTQEGKRGLGLSKKGMSAGFLRGVPVLRVPRGGGLDAVYPGIDITCSAGRGN